jgi:hypothetical protein
MGAYARSPKGYPVASHEPELQRWQGTMIVAIEPVRSLERCPRNAEDLPY